MQFFVLFKANFMCAALCNYKMCTFVCLYFQSLTPYFIWHTCSTWNNVWWWHILEGFLHFTEYRRQYLWSHTFSQHSNKVSNTQWFNWKMHLYFYDSNLAWGWFTSKYVLINGTILNALVETLTTAGVTFSFSQPH